MALHSPSSTRISLAAAVVTGLLLAGAAPALEPVFSNDTGGATRDVKVCVLLLQATRWENNEPNLLPTLAAGQENSRFNFVTLRNLRPASWHLVNPLAPTVVTPAISALWSLQTHNKPVIFDGVSAVVDNDRLGNGNGDAAAIAANEGQYQANPTAYGEHCSPLLASQIAALGDLPGVGQALPTTHPAYWEVPLTPVTVSQLANFDAVIVNTQRNIRFSQEEQILLRQFLDMGGTLYLEDSHGCRMMVKPGGTPTNPADVDFFLPFQFVDGYPWPTGTAGTRPDGYPINRGSVNPHVPNVSIVSPNHPLLNTPNVITASEATTLLGDVLARDHLLIRPCASIFRVEEVLRTTNDDTQWGNQTGTLEPAVAVARIGSGKLILSGLDVVDDAAKPGDQNLEPQAGWLPDIKFLLNVIAWRGGEGGNRRGGANNQGVAANQAPRSLTPKFLWHEPSSWTGTTTDFANTDLVSPTAASLQSDANYLLKEPLCAANGVIYLQYQRNGHYWLTAVDANPESDLDGDGMADDGPVRDMTDKGATSDTLWRLDLGTAPLTGATVVSITHATKNVPVDVLLATQFVPGGNGQIRLYAIHATVDNLINNTAPVETPGQMFANWPAAGNPLLLAPSTALEHWGSVSAPVVYDDKVYFTLTCDRGVTNLGPTDYAVLYTVNLLDDPNVAGNQAGTVAWHYPDGVYRGESQLTTTPAQRDPVWNLLRQVDPVQNIEFFTPPLVDNCLSFTGGSPTLQVPANSPVAPTMPDTTHLTPAIGLVRDARSGLTQPTAFLNRAGGDVWAVAGAPESFGWRIEGVVSNFTVTLPALPAIGSYPAVPARTLTATPSTDLNSNGIVDVQVKPVLDTAGTQTASDIVIDPALWRERPLYESLQLSYTLSGVGAVRESRTVFPRHRLLRGDRHSGYERADTGTVDLLGWSTGAPMVLDADTVVGTSASLSWPSAWTAASWTANYSNSTMPGTAYQLRASGPVTFYDAAADAGGPSGTDSNDTGAIRWAFDPGSVLPNTLAPLLSYPPAPASRPTFSVYGAPVKHGDMVVVAGSWLNSANGGGGIASGGVMAIAPKPSLQARIVNPANPSQLVSLDSRYPVYLLTANPSGWGGVAGLSSYGGTVNASNLRAWVVDPRQYTIDGYAGVVSLRASDAHLTRLADPLPDTAGAEANPKVFRTPLYGRWLWLVQDVNRDGLYNAGDAVYPIYVPSPARWMAIPDTILLDAQGFYGAPTDIRVAGGAVIAAGDYSIDPLRPIITFNTGAYRGKEIQVTYPVFGTAVVEKHRVCRKLPGFCFSPVVAGDTLYVSGTQMGTLSSPAIPSLDLLGNAPATNDNGGVYAFRYGLRDHEVMVDWLRPDSLPSFPNFSPLTLDNQLVRGVPLAAGGNVYVSFAMQGVGGTGAGQMAAPLYALGGSNLLITESQRVAQIDFEGNVVTQFTGTKVKNAAERPAATTVNNPKPVDLLTVPLSHPAKAYALPGDQVLLVDTGNDRVVVTDSSGLVTWPLDSRTGHPDGVLRYLGLRNLGLKQPQDALRYRVAGREHPYRSGTFNNSPGTVIKDVTVIADTGNKRVLAAVSHNAAQPFYDQKNNQPGSYTYYEPLLRNQQGFGDPWVLTSPQVYNPSTQRWVDMSWCQVQAWQPASTDLDARYNASNDAGYRYFVARAEGSDQLFNLDPDPDRDGDWDKNQTGVVDGVQRNLANMLDQWSGGMVFRGLRHFTRFRIGQTPYLAVIMSDQTAPQYHMVMVYEHTGAATPINPVWSFGYINYWSLVYGPDVVSQVAYYTRKLSNLGFLPADSLALRQRWYGGTAVTAKQWNPTAVIKLPYQNLLAIVNGAANSVNQTASNSEVLLVRLDPNAAVGNQKRVEYMLPDLTTTTTYPAGQAASQRRPDTGSYPVSSPVFVSQ